MKVLDLQMDAVRVIVWQMTENMESVWREMSCPEQCFRALDGIGNRQRRKEFVFVRYLFFLAFGTVKDIVYGLDGKPCLADDSAYISISHSGDYAAIAFCKDHEVGLDVEVLGNKVMRVRERFLGMEEQQELAQTEVAKHHVYWSAKEAVYKMVGSAAVDFSKAIRVEPFRLAAAGGCFYASLPADGRRFRLDYLLDDGFVLVLARRKTE